MRTIITLIILFSSVLALATGLDYPIDGVSKTVKIDTITPANSRPYPYAYYNILGVRTDLATESTLSTLNGKFGTLGQKTMAGSAPVVIASDQSTLAISAASLPLPSGAATEATLSTLNGKVNNDYGVSSGAVRTASQIGNDSGVADFNYGTVGAQTLRVASQIGNATGAVDFNRGSSSAQTIRTAANIARNGNELSYGSGTLDANTLRVVLPTDQPTVDINVTNRTGTVKQAAITVGTSATRITTDGSAPSSTRKRLSFMLDQASTANCYMGSSGVTTTSTTRGLYIFPAATNEFVQDANDYYLICDAASQTVFVLEVE